MSRFRPLNFRAIRSRRRGRDERGIYLLETVVAITIGGIITLALLQMLTGSMRTMTVSAGESYASEIMNSLCEFTVASGYSGLNVYPGTFTLLLNKTAVGTAGPDVYKRPVLLDFVRKQWQEKSKSRAFNGAVTYTVSGDQIIDGLTALNVTIDISWTDSNTSGQRRLQRVITLFK